MSTVQFQLGGSIKFLADEEGYVLVRLKYGGFTITAKGDVMAYTLPDDKSIAVQVAYVDAKGNPAKVDGDVTWGTSDSALATVESTAPDSAMVKPVGQLGQVQITATADADLGAGIRELITTMDVEIVSGEAVAGTITPSGEPQPIPAA
jgi:hypothetical protein